MKANKESKEQILDAATAVVLARGAGHLTLDAVAAQAGLSKGGLLYHFPSKESLLHGLIDRMHKQFDQAQAEALAERKLNLLQAYVIAAFRKGEKRKRLGAALLAAAANNPKLLGPARKENARRFDAFRHKAPGYVRAMTVVLAAHGLWLLEVLETSPFSSSERKKICAELLALSAA